MSLGRLLQLPRSWLRALVLRARSTILQEILREIVLACDPRSRDPSRLLRFGARVTSQFDQDGIIAEIFRRIGSANRTFVELGVGDGRENNTLFLIACGWKGYWVDACGKFLSFLRRNAWVRNGIVGYCVTTLTRENVTHVLRDLGVPQEFDLFSIDVDLNTFWIWQGLDYFRPRAVVIEYNALVPPQVPWVVPYDPRGWWRGDFNFGAGLKALELLGRTKGYVLVGCNFWGVDAFFVRQDLVREGEWCSPFTSENHWEPPRYSLIFGQHKRKPLVPSACF